MEQAVRCYRRLPGLFYADNVVLIAGSVAVLQSLLDICAEEGNELGLRFSAKKSAASHFPSGAAG